MALATTNAAAPMKSLSQKEVEIQMILAAEVHLNAKNCDFHMERYVFSHCTSILVQLLHEAPPASAPLHQQLTAAAAPRSPSSPRVNTIPNRTRQPDWGQILGGCLHLAWHRLYQLLQLATLNSNWSTSTSTTIWSVVAVTFPAPSSWISSLAPWTTSAPVPADRPSVQITLCSGSPVLGITGPRATIPKVPS
ncbi:hypothetical protein MLD38_030097 [Melastoma candidum]|uniref:Uncharacterized protein n=1 Tax=Melastoma candidum TaxID=119954 RepID=A0ACB9MLX1_9MYRT|nr:hypothetical protein MLD38_030097 [Melastoma candidum]